MNSTEKAIVNEYKRKKDIYLKLEEKVYEILSEIVSENSIFVMDVAHRTKEVESLKGKLERKGGKYKSLLDITDICGFRIICYFADAIDQISEIMAERFVIDKENSVDKRAVIDATQFGYLSLHMICSLKKNDGIDDSLVGIPFEIQIRTVLQHVWAEIEHDLGYKSDFGIPRPIRRNFSRVAGLLEIADRQFVEIRKDANSYNLEIHEKIKNDNCESVLLDHVSMKEYINCNKGLRSFVDRVKRELFVDVEYSDVDSIMSQLEWFGLDTLGDFSTLFNNNMDYAYSKVLKLSKDLGVDIITSTVLLRFFFEGELIRACESKARVTQYYQLIYSDADKISHSVNKLLSINN